MEKPFEKSDKLEDKVATTRRVISATGDEVVMKRRRVKKRKKKSMVSVEQPTIKKRKRKLMFDDSQLVDDEFEKLIIENHRDNEATKSKSKASRLTKKEERTTRGTNLPIVILILVVIVGFSMIIWNQGQREIRVPNFGQATAKEIQNWAEVNQVELATQSLIDKGNWTNLQSVPAGETIRKGSKLTILVNPLSDFANKEEMPDFTGQTKAVVEEWLGQVDLTSEFIKVYSNTIPSGRIVSQSLASGEKLKSLSDISFTISKGKEVKKMPDFSQMDLTEAKMTAKEEAVLLIEEYSDSKPFGAFVSQTLEPNQLMTNAQGKVTYSLGQPYLTSYYGSNEGEIPHKLFNDFNSKGAKITFNTYEVYSAEPKGTVVQENICNQFMSLDQHLEFGISNGAADYWGY